MKIFIKKIFPVVVFFGIAFIHVIAYAQPSTTCNSSYTRNPNMNIDTGPTNDVVTDNLTLTNTGITLTDMNVIVKINHTWIGDIRATLVHQETGTTVVLINRPKLDDSPPDGCGGDNIDAELDDQAATLADEECTTNNPSINGVFKPTTALSGFNGESLDGTWSLIVNDNSPALDAGKFVKWCLVPNGIHVVNNPPVIKNSSGTPVDSLFVTIDKDSTLTMCLNVTDANGHNVDITAGSSLSGNGTVTTDPPGDTCFSYTPNSGFVGKDNLRMIVCDNGSPSKCDSVIVQVTVNDPSPNNMPVADDDVAFTDKNTMINIPVLDNDMDDQGLDTASIMITKAPANGTSSPNSDGTIMYTPANEYTGKDTLKYRICDKGTPALCDEAEVIITVIDPLVNNAPLAVDDNESATQNLVAEFIVLDNDVDPEGAIDTASMAIVDIPANGDAQVTVDGKISYTPNSGFLGKDTLTYRICDEGLPALCDTATVFITVEDPNGIETDKYPAVYLYPNPSRGLISISFKGNMAEACSIIIWDIPGNKVYEQQVKHGKQHLLDLSFLEDGMYFIQVRQPDEILNGKIYLLR